MKIYFCKYLLKSLSLIFFISLFPLNNNFSNAESLIEDLQIDSSTKSEGDNSSLPTNPFEIVEMIRRVNSLNNATSPSDALDDALNSYNNLEKETQFDKLSF